MLGDTRPNLDKMLEIIGIWQGATDNECCAEPSIRSKLQLKKGANNSCDIVDIVWCVHR